MAALALCPAQPLRAEVDDAVSTVSSTVFSFDFSAPPAEAAELQEVQLHYSVDGGKTWKLYRGVPPSDGKITFEAAGDGEYWFAVQQVYKDGRRRPSRMENVTPQRKVRVDTAPPRVELRPISEDGKVGVEWSIRSDDAELSTMRLESRSTLMREWAPIALSPQRSGRKTWEPEGKGDLEVRLRVSDAAGNEASSNVFVNPARSSTGRASPLGDADSFPEPAKPGGLDGQRKRSELTTTKQGGRLVADGEAPVSKPTAGAPSTSAVPTFYVNKLKFNVDYKLSGMGKSGCKAVHLFWRHPDEPEWQDYGPNAGGVNGPYKVAVSGEGKYGIRMRAMSGVGLAEEVPKPGAVPHLWVVVDATPPTVQLDVPKVRFSPATELTIAWKISDENPGGNKVRLLYSAVDGTDAGKWVEIAKGQLDEGQFKWKPPANAPYRFHVRVEAEDAAGNSGQDDTLEPVSIDDSKPQAVAVKVEAISDGDEPSAKPVSAPEPTGQSAPPSKKPTGDDDVLGDSVRIGREPPASGEPKRPRGLPKPPSL